MPIVIITRDQLQQLALDAGAGRSGGDAPPTLHDDQNVHDDRQRSLEDACLAALGLKRLTLPAGTDPVAALARAAIVAAHNWGYQADRGDNENEAADAVEAEQALMIGIGMLCAGQLPAPQDGPGRFYTITTSHADPADGANLLPRDHRVVLVEPLGDAGYRYLVEKPGTAPVPTALERFDAIAAGHGAEAAVLKDAGDEFLLALGCWEAVSADPRAAPMMAEEGWTVENTPTAGWIVKRRPDAYLWDTDAAALTFVRQRAPEVILHQAAINLVDAQIKSAMALGLVQRP